jgi:hypothetical protein
VASLYKVGIRGVRSGGSGLWLGVEGGGEGGERGGQNLGKDCRGSFPSFVSNRIGTKRIRERE